MPSELLNHREVKRERAKLWRLTHLEYARQRDRERGATLRGMSRAEYRRYAYTCNLRWKYGLSRQEYDAMVLAAQGLCEICAQHTQLGLDLDHNHRTGKARGLLCRNCNSMIGKYEPFAETVAAYLARI